MNDEFRNQRRQQFLDEAFAKQQIARRVRMKTEFAEELRSEETDIEGASLLTSSAAEYEFEHLLLRYTAGLPLDDLRDQLNDVIEAYERFQKALAAYEQIPEAAPLGLGNIGDYERCMQLIALCYLLHRRDLLPRIAALQDPAYIGSDALYEDLLRYGLPDRPETDDLLHFDAYDLLLGAMWEQDNAESTSLLNQYVSQWYLHFKYVPWHDGHVRINGTDGDYFGYWAFEAGAVALLCDIDDSDIDHMVYPRDLVAWSRANKHLSSPEEAQAPRLRCEAGQPCPQAGFWSTPAQPNSRRRFSAGELMPIIEGSAWGATIWYWDADQGG